MDSVRDDFSLRGSEILPSLVPPNLAPKIPVVKIKSASGAILPVLLEMTGHFG